MSIAKPKDTSFDVTLTIIKTFLSFLSEQMIEIEDREEALRGSLHFLYVFLSLKQMLGAQPKYGNIFYTCRIQIFKYFKISIYVLLFCIKVKS